MDQRTKRIVTYWGWIFLIIGLVDALVSSQQGLPVQAKWMKLVVALLLGFVAYQVREGSRKQ
jgi:hypothetical protein